MASNLGWLFDGYETYALIISVGVALRQLLDPSQYAQIPAYAGTVIVNGLAVSGCLYLALFIDGADVVTIESLDTRDKLSPVQEAFIEASAFQCGYCTPGFIMMVTQLLDEHPDPSDDQIKHYLTGNLCRCATYPEVMDAVKLAAKKRKAGATA